MAYHHGPRTLTRDHLLDLVGHALPSACCGVAVVCAHGTHASSAHASSVVVVVHACGASGPSAAHEARHAGAMARLHVGAHVVLLGACKVVQHMRWGAGRRKLADHLA